MNLPIAALSQHIIVLGKTRSGKSSTIRLLVESLLDDKKPVCIIDPKGDWWGLKSSANGKQAGYPVVIFGGEHADVPLNAHAGGHVAELIATGNRPCIIDLGGWMVGDRTRFFIDFASTLFRQTRGQRWLVIDEVHNFCPQGKVLDPDAGKMLHWSNRLASEGLGKGLQLIAASQRPQKVHKDFVTSCETLIAMRVIHPLDRGAIKDWIDGCPDPEKGREVLNTLASMPRGHGWVWSPEIGFGPVKVAFPRFSTYDSFKAPTSEAATKLKGWAEVDLDEVKDKLASVVEEAKQKNPSLLRQQIAALKHDLDELRRAKPEAKQSIKTVSAFKDGQIKRLESLFDKIIAEAIRHGQAMSMFWKNQQEIAEALLAAVKSVTGYKEPVQRQPARIYQLQKPAAVAKPEQVAHDRNSGMDKAQRAFLTALAQQQRPLTRNQIAIFAGYSAKSGHVDNTLGKLRSGNYINGNRNSIRITDDGLVALGSYDPLPIGRDLQNYWIKELDLAASKFLAVICEAYPATLGRDELAVRAGYSPESGHVDNMLGQLRSRDLISGGRHAIKASDELF
jgi:hypothetical protein